eukprot:67121-Prymnesium_polylepis.1
MRQRQTLASPSTSSGCRCKRSPSDGLRHVHVTARKSTSRRVRSVSILTHVTLPIRSLSRRSCS